MPAPTSSPARHGRARWPRALALAFAVLLLVLVAAMAAAWWWAGTEGSLARAITWASRSQPLAAEQVTGALRQGGRVGRLSWRDPQGLHVEATDIALEWQPLSLLRGRLVLKRFAAASIHINDQRAPAAPSGPPESVRLPLAITLDEIAIGKVVWVGPPAFEANSLRGRYSYSGAEHQLDLANAQVAGGRYQGRVTLGSGGELPLKATLAGVIEADVPGSSTRLPLSFDATGEGPLTALDVKAALRMSGDTGKGPRPQASATARFTPWAAQPLPEAQATFRDVDVALLWPQAPRTQLTGEAAIRPDGAEGWRVSASLGNALPGPWNQGRLPVQRLQAAGEWRGGKALLRSLDALVAGGRVQASGEWAGAATGPAAAALDWKLAATFQQINPAAIHSDLAAQSVDGRAAVSSEADTISFDTRLEAVNGGSTTQQAGNAFAALRLRDLVARGNWRAAQAGGTLALATLRVRTSDAELAASGVFQPQAQGGQGRLTLSTPGLRATAEGEARPDSGAGQLDVRAADAGQALRWLRSLPGLGATLKNAGAQGRAELALRWQGGWRDPTLDAQLAVPTLDWTAAPTAASAEPIRLRALQASLKGRLSQAQLSLQARAESGARRLSVQLAAEGGGSGAARGAPPWAASTWQALIRQVNLSVQDPALGEGAWRVESQRAFSLRWASGAVEAGAGQAVLIAPAPAGSAAPSQALLSWQASRWRQGEIVTAGTLKGLPLAWIELVAGPQMAGAGLAGNLVFDGEWDAVIGQTLRLKAALARSSGDISVQAETGQGRSTRVAAGIREARLALSSEGDSVTATLRWDSERAGTADGQLRTRLQAAPQGGWAWPADAPLNGQLRAQLPRIGAWSVLAPPGWRLRGSLATDLVISGTRSAPQLTGELRADDLALRSVVDGIEFGNGRLRAQLDGTVMRISEFTLQGAGGRGKGGLLTARGEAGWVNGQAQASLSARLDGLRASIRTDRQLTVSGDLQAALTGRQASITGALRVDQARIILPDEGRPQLGDDVIVRGTQGAAAGKQAPAQANASPPAAGKAAASMKIDVKLDLGNDFRVEGKGIDTRLRGTLALSGESLTAPRLVGTVSTVDGRYRAYGQRLDIEQGVLRFTGPVDNPALDILAVRPNMTQRVGVQITGTALLPSVRLYAQPELPDAEKLSWLVLGRASATGGAEAALLQQAAVALLGSKTGSSSGGIASRFGLDELSFSGGDGGAGGAAITLGKRFSRNFYAAYERSLSGALGTLSVFYELSQRFTVRGQTGEQTAIDLIYTVPYD